VDGDAGMNADRWLELETNPDAKLTKEEVAEGWHFCPDWDFMLIHQHQPEYDACLCNKGANSGRLIA
jgi:hypothetical protein